jgi:hypothetical protein
MTLEDLSDENPDALLLDGFEDAYIGAAVRCAQPPLAVYDRDKCIEVLVQRDGMTVEDAEEYFEFNVSGAWVGPHTPLILVRCEPAVETPPVDTLRTGE